MSPPEAADLPPKASRWAGHFGESAGSPTVTAGRPGHGRSLALWLVVTVIILIVALAIIGSLHVGTIDIVVTHACCFITISATIVVDGKTIATPSITPGEQWTGSYPVTWFGDGCSIHSVVADGSGGSLGPTSDSAQPTICPGQAVQVDLSV